MKTAILVDGGYYRKKYNQYTLMGLELVIMLLNIGIPTKNGGNVYED